MYCIGTAFVAVCLVDASDDDVKHLREKYPYFNIYRRNFDGDLPDDDSVIFLLPDDSDKYSVVLGRKNVTTEVVLDNVHGI